METMNSMIQRDLVAGIPHIDVEKKICGSCLLGKQARQTFPNATSYRASKVLELIHGDLCGAITPTTLAGNKYIFGYRGAPIRNASVSIGNGQMRMTGSMHKGIDIPFDITAQVLVTPDGMMRIHPIKTKILKLNGDALMKLPM